ncbi:MAG TPA: hypothetical protein ENK48_05740 [Gammaproteobacteria bacterium]|nr:hypothetical protein [Gammaproteobacteria bacterium]
MKRIILSMLGGGTLLFSCTASALDSYRYLHVTIETPWMIFLVLLPIVLSPFIIMAILYWRFAMRKSREEDGGESQ